MSTGGTGVIPASIDAADVITIVIYFVLVLGVGFYSMIGVKTGTEEGYFLAGRFMTWLPVGASLFATNIGSEHYVGLAGSGAEKGIAVGAFELNALFLLPLLGWVFIPVYMASGVGTLPEYMTKRYGGQRIRMMLSVVSLIMYVLTKNSVDMYAGALFIRESIGWPIPAAIALILGMTILSTIAGGLTAVIYTDTLQCFIMIGGGLMALILGMQRIGGFEALQYEYPRALSRHALAELEAGNETKCGIPPQNAWEMLREPLDSEAPWPGFVFGQTVASIWYWCADQMMVQRVLAAKSLSHAQGGAIFCGIIKITSMFALILPGMISRVLYPEIIGCSTAEACMRYCQSKHSCSNLAYPKLIVGILPSGLRGVIIAVMLSATMSDLSSTFNSASTLFTMDLYKLARKTASTRELMIVGRLAVVGVVAIGIGTIPLIMLAQGNQLFTYIQAISSYFAPPIAAVYLVSILWKRSNEKGTFWGLTVGVIAGIVRTILGFIYTDVPCRETDNRPAIIKNVHYMYYAMISFWVVVITNVVISLITAPDNEEKTIRTLFWTRNDRTIRSDEIVEEDDIEHIEMSVKPKEEPAPVDVLGTESRARKLSRTVTRQLSNLLLGSESDYKEEQQQVLKEKDQVRQLLKLTSLRQSRQAKILLSLGAIFLMAVGTFMYLFFSVGWNVKTKPVYFK